MAFRLWEGGVGATAGVVGIAISACVGICFAHFGRRHDMSPLRRIGLALASNLAILSIFVLPWTVAISVLGKIGGLGKKLGLDDQWGYRIIKQVGSYKDIYDRNFGEKSPLKLPRGLNKQWTQGGLLYGYPIK